MNRKVVKKEPRLICNIIINEWMPFFKQIQAERRGEQWKIR